MRIELHQITRCGFYARGVDRALFGALRDWHADFHNWVQSRKNVSQTSTFQLPEAVEPNVFCAGTAKSSYGLGLILWHGVPATEKGVAYIKMDALPGKVNVEEVPLAVGSIPGWSSYYWLLPQQNLLVCLQPAGKMRNRGNGLPECRHYLYGWLREHSNYVHRISREDGLDSSEIEIGWRQSNNEPPRSDLNAYFDSHPVVMPCAVEEIRQRCDEIRKLVHAVQINRALAADRDRLMDLMRVMGFAGYSAPETDRLGFRWESDWRPTLEELDVLIQRQWSDAAGRKERQAVRFRGDSTLHWLDGGPVKEVVEIPDELENALNWSPNQLAQAWAHASERVQELVELAQGFVADA